MPDPTQYKEQIAEEATWNDKIGSAVVEYEKEKQRDYVKNWDDREKYYISQEKYWKNQQKEYEVNWEKREQYYKSQEEYWEKRQKDDEEYIKKIEHDANEEINRLKQELDKIQNTKIWKIYRKLRKE